MGVNALEADRVGAGAEVGKEPQETAKRRQGGQGARRVRIVSLPIGIGVLLIFLWWVVTEYELVSRLLLPRPGDVLDRLSAGIIGGLWWTDLATTFQEVAGGFVIGATLGITVGAIFGFTPLLHKAFYPYILALMSMPKIAIAPLLVVAFGYGLMPKIIIAALLAFFPVMTSSLAGLTKVNPDELNLLRSVRASKWQELRYLRIPNSVSYIFPSLDVALISALLGAVAAELVGAQEGLGYLISTAQAYGDVPTMYGVFIILACIGVSLRMLVVLGRRALPRSFNA